MNRAVRIAVAKALLLVAIGGCGEARDEQTALGVQPSAMDVGRVAPADPETMLEQLEALGYARGSVEAPAVAGVTRHEADAYEGFNLYNSGHAPEAVLMDMEGEVLHRWHSSFDRTFPEHPRVRAGASSDGGWQDTNTAFWRRVHLFENGDLIAIHDGLGIVRLDKDSNILWAKTYPVHHDLEVMPNGDLYVLSRQAHVIPRVHRHHPVMEDFVLVLAADGSLRRRISLLEIFENSEEPSWTQAYREFWEKERTRGLASPSTDLFHTNSLRVLDRPIAGLCPDSCAGKLLVSMCHLDMVAVVSLEENRVLWSYQGPLALQHDPTITRDDKMLIFNNHSEAGRRSSVMIVDPATKEIVWEYSGQDDDVLYSRTCGTSAQLPNGNILITETDQGRALEVTRDEEVVWEFYNPNRAGQERELIASLFEVVRLPPDFPIDWAEGSSVAKGASATP